jgi:hypothetical protein
MGRNVSQAEAQYNRHVGMVAVFIVSCAIATVLVGLFL